jgi:tape measure domain-containing protein
MPGIFYTMGLNSSNFVGGAKAGENALGRVESKASSLRSVIGGLTTAFAALGAGAAAFKGLQLAADAEKTEVGLNTILKSTQVTKALIQELRKLAAETPLELPELTGGARTLLGGGFQLGTLVKDLKMLGDVAAGAQTDLGGLATVLNQVKGKGKLYAEELQQFAERGVSGLREALAKVRGTSVEELFTDMQDGEVVVEDLMAAFRSLTSEGGMFFNAMKNQAGTTYGLISSLKDNFNELVLVFTRPINDGMQPAIANIISGLNDATAKARQFMGALNVAVANGRTGDFLYQSLKLAFMNAANFGVKVFAGLGAALAGIDTAFDFLKNESLWRAGVNYLKLGLDEAGYSFLAILTSGLRQLNSSLPSMLKMDDEVLANREQTFKSAASTANGGRALQGMEISKFLGQQNIGANIAKGMADAGKNFTAGMKGAAPAFDTAGQTAMLKDFYTAARSNYESSIGAQNKAMTEAAASSNKVATAATSASQALDGIKEKLDTLKSKIMGDGGGAAGAVAEGGGRKRITSFNAAESTMRQFMRLSPKAREKYDGSFDAFFGKGQKVGVEKQFQNFMTSNRGQRAGVMAEMGRNQAFGPQPGMDLLGQVTRANSRVFSGLPGRRGADDGKGNSVLEQLMREVAKNTEGLAAK